MARFPVRLVLSALAIAAAVACGEQASPTAPSLALAPPPPPPKGHKVASCVSDKDVTVSGDIGFKGGKLDLGNHNTFVVMPGALFQTTRITAHIPKGSEAKVQFTPEGLRFNAPAVLTMNYANCSTPFLGVTVAYLRADTVVEVVPSANDPLAKTVKGFISHFSSYAVAY